MKQYFRVDPVYTDQFSDVWLWSEWAAEQPSFAARDLGIDLVAAMRDGGYCAIQCKFHAPDSRITKAALDSFIAASDRDPFTRRMVVDTGAEWGPNAQRTIDGLKPPCQVMRFNDLADRPIEWPDLDRDEPEALEWHADKFDLRAHQRAAFDDVVQGFVDHDRGRLIMACGTGKTFTALRIAEAVAGVGGRVLYLVPSIALFQQAMREWAEQRALLHRYIGICSDARAGRQDEDASFLELEIPVTTDPAAISEALGHTSLQEFTVVFCTYQSLSLVAQAQDAGAPPFDLVLCDEAHRTTGVDHPEDKTSPFVLVHDPERIRTAKRLYMTATPRLYTQSVKTRAASHSVEVFSMDDENTYGPEFHRLPFSRAVEQGLLSDYKVVVLALSETHVDKALQAHLASSGGAINLTDAARIIGCWRALQNPENRRPENGPVQPLRRAIAFTNTIRSSRSLTEHWSGIIEQAAALLPETERSQALRCETQHVDGQHHALERKARIEWLKRSDEGGACRILSNARCLSEGIDVPALDAVLFMSERKSTVDIVQAVGRAMRKAEGKTYGYIVLPVAVPAGEDPARVLDSGNAFDVVWSVLRALRSHDDRLDAEINQIDLNRTPTNRIIFTRDGLDVESAEGAPELPFPVFDFPPEAIYARIVEKCGDRKYWESWAKDVAAIFTRLVTRIGGLLENPENDTLRQWFGAFHEELKASINESITTDGAVDMMAQHILTQPVFEALFVGYDFASGNPVARALDALRADFGEFGLENETRDLEGFYESVRLRARGLDNPDARQRVLMELYEKFFATALKKDADRLGIVYTPVEVVDFILASAAQALRTEYGRSLSDDGVHVLDPFAGTGIFLVRLLQSALVRDADLERKYHEELHANEIVLLAYYIAAIHIEEAFHGRKEPRDNGASGDYEPFGGIVLTDTFNLHTDRTGFPRAWLPDNSQRVERQQRLPIQVIIGNPPWSAGQKSSADDNPNVDYPELERRIVDTYAVRSTATLKTSLYNSYRMAIRWASDRIGDQGVVAFVTNGSWLYGHTDSGVRACLEEEFNTVYVVNLRGNARTLGDRRRAEGHNIFGQGSRDPVAITILIRNSDGGRGRCRIYYRDIGDYLSREDKLTALRRWGSIAGIDDWEELRPDQHHDWIEQRDETFAGLYPMGSKEAKAGRSGPAIFRLYSNGYKTGRDAYVYNFSRTNCVEGARQMVGDYSDALRDLMVHEADPEYTVDDAVGRHASNIHWDQKLKDRVWRRIAAVFSDSHVRPITYRPFVKQHLYADEHFAQRPALNEHIFPMFEPGATYRQISGQRAICVPGVGSTKPFSALMVDTMPDLHCVAFGQCFPRYRYQRRHYEQGELSYDEHLANGPDDLERIDNITEAALNAFRERYGDDPGINKDAIFDYVYGVLHSPAYQQRFANDLAKALPRVPMANDFHAFARAGTALAELHLGYETCPEYPLDLVPVQPGTLESQHFRIGQRAMRFADDSRTILIVNEHLRLEGIPHEAHEYSVNGRTPLEWFIDRYRITRDRESGIINDPNGWFDDPRDLITAIRRIVHVSVETVHIVARLPDPFAGEDCDQGGGPS